jgi:ABC-type bacteriocin/lantibiotic exporter with double-glycine peptidase domain
MQQLMNIGQFVAAEIIILTIIGSVEKLIMSLDDIYDIITGLEKISQVTDLELEDNIEQEFKDFEFSTGIDITLEDISFRYPGYYKETLSHLNLSIESGARLGIIGRNGSGKSTLLQIISGLYEVNFGNLLYNGLPKSNIGYNSFRSLIGVHITDDDLFEGTLEENISMKRPGIDFKALNETCNALFLSDFIKSLPDGFKTQINPKGNKLPKNITQKLLLARAIIANPKLLILETKFENLDTHEKKQIVDYLVDKDKPWTLIAGTTDNYFLNSVDKVALMENGGIKEVAPYGEIENKSDRRD